MRAVAYVCVTHLQFEYVYLLFRSVLDVTPTIKVWDQAASIKQDTWPME